MIVPSLAMGASGNIQYVGRHFLLLDRRTAVALARNAYGRWFPEVQGPPFAEKVAAQIDWLREQDDASFPYACAPSYVSAPIINAFCIGLYVGKANHVVRIVRQDSAGVMRTEPTDNLVGDVVRSVRERQARIVSRNRGRDFPSN
ncbi:hypothetical protein [Variovorax sp. PDC80]|uniref:hypothetical protein n=1 Tax=Variovorax sp. PDC80 TaxID=1882827 RepID=UPI001160B8A0|nr:hypothetical protein [Variovorax sp. PDC80]